MRNKRYYRSSHPLTALIDKAVDEFERDGYIVDTGSITAEVANAPGPLMVKMFGQLVGPAVRRRLVQRGYIVTNADTLERKLRADATADEFAERIKVRRLHVGRVTRWDKAEQGVLKFLRQREQRLGRTVTLGEFEAEIDHIYTRHGV